MIRALSHALLSKHTAQQHCCCTARKVNGRDTSLRELDDVMSVFTRTLRCANRRDEDGQRIILHVDTTDMRPLVLLN